MTKGKSQFRGKLLVATRKPCLVVLRINFLFIDNVDKWSSEKCENYCKVEKIWPIPKTT
jgi:hypothetical protein